MKKIYVYFFVFIAASSVSLRAMEEILPKNPKNAALLKQKIKEYNAMVKRGEVGSIHYFSKCLHGHIGLNCSDEEREKKIYENLCRYYNKEDEDDKPVLIALVKRGYWQEVELALLAGADPNVRDRECTPLGIACKKLTLKPQLIKVLLNAGAYVDYIYPCTGRTLLHEVIPGGNLEVARMLFNAGVDRTTRDSDGKSLFDMVNRIKDYPTRYEMATLVLEWTSKDLSQSEVERIQHLKQKIREYVDTTSSMFHHPSISFQYGSPKKTVESMYNDVLLYCNIPYQHTYLGGILPIYEAIENDNVALLEILLLAGADVEGRLQNGKYVILDSPLKKAISKFSVEMVEVLLRNKADFSRTDDEGKTCFDHAQWLWEATQLTYNSERLSILQQIFNLLQQYEPESTVVQDQDDQPSDEQLSEEEEREEMDDPEQVTLFGVERELQGMHIGEQVSDENDQENFFKQFQIDIKSCRKSVEAQKNCILDLIERNKKSILNRCSKRLGEGNVSDYLGIEAAFFYGLNGAEIIYTRITNKEYKKLLYSGIKCCDVAVVQIALLAGYDYNKVFHNHDEDKWYSTALHLAVEKGNVEIVRLLLLAGANPNITTDTGVALSKYAREDKGFHKIAQLIDDFREK